MRSSGVSSSNHAACHPRTPADRTCQGENLVRPPAKHHRPQTCTSPSPGGWTSMVRVPGWSGSGEDPFQGCRQPAVFLLGPQLAQREERALWGPFHETLIPSLRAPPPSHWGFSIGTGHIHESIAGTQGHRAVIDAEGGMRVTLWAQGNVCLRGTHPKQERDAAVCWERS